MGQRLSGSEHRLSFSQMARIELGHPELSKKILIITNYMTVDKAFEIGKNEPYDFVTGGFATIWKEL